MTGRTHDLAAFTALNLLFISQPLVNTTFATAFVTVSANLIGGLTPDIDQATADLWNRLPAGSIIGRMITPLLGSHRMISHSILGIFLAGFLSYKGLHALGNIILVDMNLVWIGFMVGFISHIAIDIFTKEGEPLLFPLPFRVGLPPIRFLRIKTGGIMEKSLVFPSLMLLNGYLIYTHYQKYLEFLKLYIIK